MSAEGTLQDAKLGDLLEAGDEALALGEARAAHDIWRAAAVANPYDERVWLALLKVLEDEEDRKVCLKNIIAINPLNTEARRQLRLLLRAERKRDDAVSTAQMAVVTPLPRPKPRRRSGFRTDAARAAHRDWHWRICGRARHHCQHRDLRRYFSYASALILAISADVL